LLPDLVTAAAALASYAPYNAEGLDWFDGMGPAVADAYRLALTDPSAVRAGIDEAREEDLATWASEHLAQPVLVNGQAGALFGTRDEPIAVIGFTIAAGRIAALNLLADQDKLRHLTIQP
jgi:DNA-binding IclR family transcriptional regulator